VTSSHECVDLVLPNKTGVVSSEDERNSLLFIVGDRIVEAANDDQLLGEARFGGVLEDEVSLDSLLAGSIRRGARIDGKALSANEVQRAVLVSVRHIRLALCGWLRGWIDRMPCTFAVRR
jgi:hypothetical protein